MLNILWPIFIVISYIYAFLTGNVENVNKSIFESTSGAVQLTITMLGTMSLWCGIMEIAQKTSFIKEISRILNPIINLLFPKIKDNEKIKEEISLNMTANILGLGNAATPMGIKAMESLQKENKNKNEISDSMAMLIVLNTASIQLIPTTVIAIRLSLGTNYPSKIIIPVWIATISAAFAGIIATKIAIKNSKNEEEEI